MELPAGHTNHLRQFHPIQLLIISHRIGGLFLLSNPQAPGVWVFPVTVFHLSSSVRKEINIIISFNITKSNNMVNGVESSISIFTLIKFKDCSQAAEVYKPSIHGPEKCLTYVK